MKRKNIINWFKEHGHIILINFFDKIFRRKKLGKIVERISTFSLRFFFRQKYEPIALHKIFNYKNIKCMCTNFENKMAAENTMFLPLLHVASIIGSFTTVAAFWYSSFKVCIHNRILRRVSCRRTQIRIWSRIWSWKL